MYIVIRGIQNDATGERYEPGEVVELGEEWWPEHLLEKGAIKLEGEAEKPKAKKPKARTVKKAVKDGNGQHKQQVRKTSGG